jgi:hypothetical protein
MPIDKSSFGGTTTPNICDNIITVTLSQVFMGIAQAVDYSKFIGRTFGNLIITGAFRTSPTPRNSLGIPRLVAKCQCGVERDYRGDNIVSGKIKSCGCARFEVDYASFIGKQFEKLLILDFERRAKGAVFLVQCNCGSTKKWTNAKGVLDGRTKSCGCHKNALSSLRIKELHSRFPNGTNSSHRMTGTQVYRAWKGMKNRCYNPNNKKFPHYGARGIKVCDEWKDSFETFYADMGEPPTKNHSLDRKDVNGNYCKDNCRWATNLEQSANRRDNVHVTYLDTGETVILAEYIRRENKSSGDECVRFYQLDLLGATEYEEVTWEPGTFVNSYRRKQKRDNNP